MSRTLDATLLAKMNSGNYNAVIRAWSVFEGARVTELEVTYFRLHLDSLEIHVTSYDTSEPEICLERGITTAGTEYTIFSSIYYVERYKYHLGIYTLYCHALYPGQSRFTIAAGMTYEDVIDTVTETFRTAVYIGAPAWKAYNFMQAGMALTLNDMSALYPLMKAKYLIYVTDYDFDSLRWFSAADALAQATEWTFTTHGHDLVYPDREYRRFFWRDETDTIHYSDGSTYPLHNLGYLESTASAPAFTSPTNPHNFMIGTVMRIGTNLKYLTGDAATIDGTKVILDVEEVFNPKESPSWYMDLHSFQFFNNTEGGGIDPSTNISVIYTSLNTSTFDGLLTSTDNNIQQAMETLDDICKKTHTWTRAQFIDGSLDEIHLRVQGMATQSVDIQTWENSSGTVMAGIDRYGRIYSSLGTSTTNLFLGKLTGNSTNSGTYNIGIGEYAMQFLTSGTQNFAFGQYALWYLTTGAKNTAIGGGALATLTTTSYNTGIGNSAAASTTGEMNTAIGAYSYAGVAGSTTGNNNTCVGMASGYVLSTGSYNTLVGAYAGTNLGVASYNIFFGNYAGSNQTTPTGLWIIDGIARASAAAEKTDSIVYGQMAVAPADQTLRFNASVGIMVDPVKKLQVLGGIACGGDQGGLASYVTLTNVFSEGISTGVGNILMCGTTNRTNTGFVKIFAGINARFIPYWTTVTG